MKTSKAPLEKKRPLFFAAGLVFALSVTLVSFEWRTPYERPIIESSVELTGEEPIWIPITLSEPKKTFEKPELPELEPEKKTPEIKIVDNDILVNEKQPDFFTGEDLPEVAGELEMSPEKDVVDELKIWEIPSVMPSYCGGETAMFKFLGSELNYPEIPRSNGVTGVVYVEFVVGKDGKLRDAKVLRPVDPWLDKEALRVAKMLDCFTPGKQAGRNVDVYFRLPIRFTLNG
jgi:protein TonB